MAEAAADTESTEKLQPVEDKPISPQKEEPCIAAVEEPRAATEHGKVGTREASQVEQMATDQRQEIGFASLLAPEGRTARSLVAEKLPLIRIIKTAEGWKALAHLHPTEQVPDLTSTNSIGPTHLRGKKNLRAKRKHSPEAGAVLAPCKMG
ncbi:hypothetical protein JB92DRAFT_3123535 [Gautieria morchelliformis]|nr:hypothetical protein JB92DRAFT_3123535 [Gautieria morchelliformis]